MGRVAGHAEPIERRQVVFGCRSVLWSLETEFLGRNSVSIFSPFEDDRRDYGEQRWVTLGLLSEKVVVIVHTETEDEIRVISMREAEKDEQLLFFSNL
jgi:uncharacterized DUF497 family protein